MSEASKDVSCAPLPTNCCAHEIGGEGEEDTADPVYLKKAREIIRQGRGQGERIDERGDLACLNQQGVRYKVLVREEDI